MGDVNKYGRNYVRGKALSEDMVSLVINEIVDMGGDTATGFFEQYSAVAAKFKLSPKTMKKVWMQFCKSGQLKPKKSCASGVKHLKPEDVDFIEFLKTDKPSMSSGDLLKEVKRHCVIPEGTSREAINRAVRNFMHDGKWSRKVMCRPAAEKFTPENIAYCQEYLNYVSTVDPFRLKFFDEAGVKLPDVGNPKYGHSLVGKPCVEIQRNSQTPNITLNLLSGADSIMYANTTRGASNTVKFLEFFGEASRNFQPDGKPILEYGDHIIMDNCSIHHFQGGQVLGEWLDDIGCVLMYCNRDSILTYIFALKPLANTKTTIYFQGTKIQ
ncbi:Ankyrin repeat domain-containing 34B [Paramuricea clavata]|uniref:Ankyrin repeat domain-containing 34B n=1 Tax=Paramuricea clavata TaxID=317549 RepID=A0A6S7IZL5_PARCT|nr:Ankyrin repeat domain-containing 34B [Paramuricea clavata]